MMNEKTRPYFHEVDEKHLFDLLNHNSDWLWEVDAEGRYTWVSGVVTELLGYPPEEVLGRTPFDFMPPEEAERVGLAFMDIVTAKRAFSGLVNRNRRADGTIVVLETSGIPLFDEQGNLSGYRGIDRNISTLGERVLQLETIYDTTPVALCMIDLHGRIVMSNKAMTRLLASAPSNAVTDYFPDVMPECWQQFLQDFSGARHGADIPSREVMFAERYYYTQPVPVYDAMDNVVGLSVTWVDITARRLAEQKLANANLVLKQFAQLDHLTGLFNRRHMDEFLIQQIAHALEQGLPLSICLVDIDFFKNFNDSQGHQSGDDCLRAVTKALASASLRPEDNISRYGGEEFLVILPRTDINGALIVAERLRTSVTALNIPHVSSPTGFLTISIGVATLYDAKAIFGEQPLHSIASELIYQADTALYKAKKQGRNRVISAAK